MSSNEVLMVVRDLLVTAVLVAAPTVLTSLVVGVLVSILQTITSIQEQTLSFVPRLLAVSVVLILTLPWSLQLVTNFAYRAISRAAGAGP